MQGELIGFALAVVTIWAAIEGLAWVQRNIPAALDVEKLATKSNAGGGRYSRDRQRASDTHTQETETSSNFPLETGM